VISLLFFFSFYTLRCATLHADLQKDAQRQAESF